MDKLVTPTPAAAPVAAVGNELLAYLDFAVVGIGASAGGLAALTAFFDATEPTSGVAYVVIQHLAPDRNSLLAEILGRHTTMPVVQIAEGMPVEPDHVYVIRPGHTIQLQRGVFVLGEPVEKRGHRHPIDDFFRSLAVEQHEKAFAVILSGMGTNGAAGAQAIKAGGGVCIAQDPATAEFPSMPASLIHSGYADRVLPPERIPGLIREYLQHPIAQEEADSADHDQAALIQVLAIMRTRTGHDFRGYKQPTLLRRMRRRMSLAGLTTLKQYANLLREGGEEIESLANDLMINVTGFFRDAQAWEALRTGVLRPLIDGASNAKTLRAWVTACSSGEEPYSLAMLICEEMTAANKHFEVKVFATDTAEKSLQLARAGIYPSGIEGDIAQERLERFFDKDEHTYRVKKEIRDMVVFARQNLLHDPPFSNIDVCTCRNFLIYLDPEAQQRVVDVLHFALREGGYLMLGSSETTGASTDQFELTSKKWRIYQRAGPNRRQFGDWPIPGQSRFANPAQIHQTVASPRPQLGPTIEESLLKEFGPPTVVVDSQDRVVYFHGRCGAYIDQPSGTPTRELFELLLASLRPKVRKVLKRARTDKRAVKLLERKSPRPRMPRLQITAAPLHGPQPGLYRISFESITHNESGHEIESQTGADKPAVEIAPPLLADDNDSGLEDELRVVRRELQTTVEAFEASTEELKASNEEVTSVNEELQSVNEELETSKEELQSVNEELLTINAQLQAKVHEVEASSNDLHNLLASADIGVVFLDHDFRVRRFTQALSDLFELIPADIGRPIAHLAPKFGDANLLHEARRVLENLTPIESEVRSDSGRFYLKRTVPYRTADHRIEGVVITFIDISRRRHAEVAMLAAQSRLQLVVEEMPAAVLIVDAADGILQLANRRAAALFGQPYPLPLLAMDWAGVMGGLRGLHDDGTAYAANEWPLARALRDKVSIVDEEIGFVHDDGRTGTLSVSCAPIFDEAGAMIAVAALFHDISQRKRAEAILRSTEERFRLLVESAQDYAIFMADLHGQITMWSSGAERLLGWSEAEAQGRPIGIIFTIEDRNSGAPQEEMRQALETGRANDERWHQRKDGRRFFASGILTIARDNLGRAQGFVKIMRDMTERKHADEQMRATLLESERLRTAAESASKAKDEFIANVSHELRTPLSAIVNWSRVLLRKQGESDETLAKGLGIVIENALTQSRLIDDLLDTSRMESGNLTLSLRPTRLIQALSGAVDAIRPVALERGVTLSVEMSDEVGIVHADSDRLQQVVSNLVGNAVKFTPRGGRVTVTLTRTGQNVNLKVADTGMGIRAEALPRIFQRFNQGDSGTTRSHSGLGLGLAIARHIIELHGGTLEAHSDGEGKGATFAAALPLLRYRDEAVERHGTALSTPNSLHGMRILLVDDSAPTREVTAIVLRDAGAQITAVDSAAAALDAFASPPPDALVSDIAMPEEDGYSLLRRIRALERSQGSQPVPAVALSAFARDRDRNQAFEAGFQEHLAKPVEPERLVAAISSLLHTSGDAGPTP